MMERTRNYFFWPFHHVKTLKLSHGSSSFILAVIVVKYKLSSSNKPAPEECFFLVLEDIGLLKLDILLPIAVEDVCIGGVLTSEEGGNNSSIYNEYISSRVVLVYKTNLPTSCP
jgi:hypothetical protein